VAGIFAVAYGAAMLASRIRFGLVALTLCLPVCAIGLSYDGLAQAAALGAVFIAASAFSYAVLVRWPEYRPHRPPAAPQLLPHGLAREYGLLLGLAGATSALIGLLIHTDHVGWAPAAGYFVMRPAADMQKLRSIGRIASVCVGAFFGVAFVRGAPPDVAIGLFAVALIAGAGATHESRWYVTPAFGSALVLTMLLYQHPTSATEQWRFNERRRDRAWRRERLFLGPAGTALQTRRHGLALTHTARRPSRHAAAMTRSRACGSHREDLRSQQVLSTYCPGGGQGPGAIPDGEPAR
jgi:hypothetical protein